MKRVVLIPNLKKDPELSVTDAVVERLVKMGFIPMLSKDIGYSPDGAVLYDGYPEECDAVIVIGGDGSVLDASVAAIGRDLPILGINLGKVGYLSEVDPAELDILYNLANGDYEIVEKMLLSVSVCDGDGYGQIDRFAVNDVVVSHSGHLGIAEIKIEDQIGNSLCYRADGVVVSTPQGSTAYSLSSGGPIVAHNVDAMIVTPISPHSFFNRSVIFNSTDRITLTNLGAEDLNLSIDGRLVSVISPHTCCRVECAEKRIRMISFSKNSMFTSLFKKMRILEDID